MKQIFFAAVLFAAVTSCKKDADTPQPAAEVTIQASDVKSEHAAGKTITFVDIDLASSTNVTIPAEGKDQTWDFSTVKDGSSYSTTFFEAGGGFDPGGYSIKTDQYFINGQLEPVQYEYTVADNGWLLLGTGFNAVTLEFPSLGGTIKYSAQTSKFSKPVLYSPSFPIKYGASESFDNAVRAENFTVNAPGLGLNNVPGAQTYTVAGSAKVIASGKLTLKGYANPMNVLVVKMQQSQTINYLLGGAPAPKQLLDMLELTDGNQIDAEWYDFYSADGEGYVGTMYLDQDKKLLGAAFKKK